MSSSEKDQARQKLREVSDRIKSDKTYARQAEQDPVGTLQAAGIPDQAIGDFLAEEGIEGEVEGYAMCWATCACTACCISGKCWVTV